MCVMLRGVWACEMTDTFTRANDAVALAAEGTESTQRRKTTHKARQHQKKASTERRNKQFHKQLYETLAFPQRGNNKLFT